MRILFMGTPEFAVPSLKALLAAGHQVCGVFTQPDRPKNRGMKLQACPVKECALSYSIPVFQPQKMRDGEAMGYIRRLDPELIVVAAYGRVLPDEILGYPKFGCLNVHSSILPRYRGAAPINWAILNGDRETGVTIMHMATELDAGDIIQVSRTPIGPQETAPQLFERLARLGAEALIGALVQLAAGTAPRTPQDHSAATFAPMLSREMSPMDWTKPAAVLHCQVRGLNPWPAAVGTFGGVRCKVWTTQVCHETTEQSPGTVVRADRDGILIACGGGSLLRIEQLQAEGGKRMSAADYLRGHPMETTD